MSDLLQSTINRAAAFVADPHKMAREYCEEGGYDLNETEYPFSFGVAFQLLQSLLSDLQRRAPVEGLDWLRQYFRDTYNEDSLSAYQLGLVGTVPSDVLAWANVEQITAVDE